MKKTVLFLLVFATVLVKAQRDSTRKFRLSGIQAEIGPTSYLDYKQQSQADYQKLVKTDPFVNADLSGYTKEGWYYINTFNGQLGLRAFASLRPKGKFSMEVFAGVKYAEESNNSIYYRRLSYDTLAVYTETVSGKKLYEVRESESYYHYRINSQKLIIPLGINMCTDKSKAFWIAMGLELAPVINFKHRLTSVHGINNTRLVMEPGDSLRTQSFMRTNVMESTSRSTQNETNLDGLGYGLYVGAPFTAYLHPFRRKVFFNHWNFFASVSPTYLFSKSKFTGPYSGFAFTMATGLRFNW